MSRYPTHGLRDDDAHPDWTDSFSFGRLIAMAALAASIPCFGCGLEPLGPAAGVSQAATDNDSPYPDFYEEPSGNPNRDYLLDTNEQIDPFGGGLQHTVVDIVLPGNGGLTLEVVRHYHHVQELPNPRERGDQSPVGFNWTLHFGQLTTRAGDGIQGFGSTSTISDNPMFITPRGRSSVIARSGSNSSLGLSRDRWAGKRVGAGWQVRSPAGLLYRFDYGSRTYDSERKTWVWHVDRIEDPDGNAIAISYTGTNWGRRPTRVTTTDGRELDFSYKREGTAYYLQKITVNNDRQRVWRYEQDQDDSGAYQLTKVTRPDGRSWRYAYHDADFKTSTHGDLSLAEVENPEGGKTEYTYDTVAFDSHARFPTTVVATKRVSGPGVATGHWSFSYRPGAVSESSTKLDETIIDFPGGRRVHRHYGIRGASYGTAWRVGLQRRVEVFDAGSSKPLETATFDWTKQQISNEPYTRMYARHGVKDGVTYAPLLARTTTRRDGCSRSGCEYVTALSNFDAYGHPTRTEQWGPGASKRTTTHAFHIDTSRWIIDRWKRQTISDVGTISRIFDSKGHMTEETRYGLTRTLRYHGSGDLKESKNPRGYKTTFDSYYRGIAREEKRPDGKTIKRSVNPDGTIASVTDARRHKISYQYDKLGRLTKIAPPLGKPISISHDLRKRVVLRSTSGSSFRETRSFDGFGRLLSIQHKDERRQIDQAFAHDALGRRRFASLPGTPAKGTTWRHDALGRERERAAADGSKVRTSYGAYNTQTVTDPRGQTTTFTYRTYGKPDGERFLTQGCHSLPRRQTACTACGKSSQQAFRLRASLPDPATRGQRLLGVMVAAVHAQLAGNPRPAAR